MKIAPGNQMMNKKNLRPCPEYFMKQGFVFILFLLATLSPVFAREDDPSSMTLERLFRPGEFSSRGFGPARWIDDGAGYTTLESSEVDVGGRDIVFYQTENGSREILVAASRLIAEGKMKPLSISDYDWSPDGKKLLVFTNTRRVWRYHTRGDYWLLDLETWKLRKIGNHAATSTLKFAKFSPDGTRIGYVCANDIYVEDVVSGATTRLTSAGTESLINGTFDWVYEEEFSLRDGYRWSPDGKRIAYWQIDASGIEAYHLVNNTDDLYPKLKPVVYPKAGTTNPACRVGVVAATGGETRWFDVPGDPRNHYIARMEWAKSSDEIVLQQLNRLQNRAKVMLGTVADCKVRTVHVDEDETWVDVCDDLKWLGLGHWFTWVSERDGWRHAYLVSRSGDETQCITSGDYDVISVVHIDEGSWLYFIASPENAAQRFLFRISLRGEGKPERITPAAMGGTHSYQVSPDARWAFHTYSSFGEPPRVDLVRLPSHETVRVLQDNSALREKVGGLARGEASFFQIEIDDGIELDAWCIKPPGFDPEKRYPLLFHVYGEPAGQTVLDRWGGTYYLWHLMLAQQGYVIMSVDNRGTPAPKGRAWRKCVYQKVGLLPSGEQAAATRALSKKWSWIDRDRIGIWGWSGGGSMTLNALFRYPDLYRTGMAIATVPDQKLYDTIYIERYMGLPQDDPEVYRQGSPITFARHLEGNLLLVHGTGDDNCHYQGPERLINELIKHNKRFTMMAYPNRGHSIYEGENTLRHLFELLTRYLNDNLPAGGR